MRYTTQSVMQSVTINNSVGRIFGAGRRAKLRTWSLPVMSSLCYAARHTFKVRKNCHEFVVLRLSFNPRPDSSRARVAFCMRTCEFVRILRFNIVTLLSYFVVVCNVFVIFVYGLVKGFVRFSLANRQTEFRLVGKCMANIVETTRTV